MSICNASSFLFLAVCLVAKLLASAPLLAQQTDHLWSGGMTSLGNRNWTATGNWVGGVPPKSFLNTNVILSGNWTEVNHPLVNEAWSVRSLRVANSSNSVEGWLSGQPLTIGAGGIRLEGPSILT